MRQHKTEMRLQKFKIVRLNRPSSGFATSNYYFQSVLGIDVTGLFGEESQPHYYAVYSRAYGLKLNQLKTDNIDTIGEYKSGDIIKSRGAYIKINYLEIGGRDIRLVGEDLGSGLERRFPMTMRPMKVYILSTRIKNRLIEEKASFLEKKKTFDDELKRLLKERNSQPMAARQLSSLGKYQAVRRVKTKK